MIEPISGRFYWALPVLDPDAEDDWVNAPQPARYKGDGKWEWIGFEGDDWPARWVGHEVSGWKSAETAPKDVRVLVAERGQHVRPAELSSVSGWTDCYNDNPVDTPTHYMPMPEPPDID